MDEAKEYGRGIYIDSGCSGVTVIGCGGAFIPYDAWGGERMEALQAFLRKYIDGAEERYPILFGEHLSWPNTEPHNPQEPGTQRGSSQGN